ncbi:MAG: hypothetical protein JSS66_09815 [Armatimonadetes bacterium]|nr:hypothetical protein [Armatimonadota bacterium]
MRRPLLLALGAVLAAACAPPATPDTLVYITEGGTKYHRKECRLKSGSHSVRLGDLPAKYTPCKVCDPPVLRTK